MPPGEDSTGELIARVRLGASIVLAADGGLSIVVVESDQQDGEVFVEALLSTSGECLSRHLRAFVRMARADGARALAFRSRRPALARVLSAAGLKSEPTRLGQRHYRFAIGEAGDAEAV